MAIDVLTAPFITPVNTFFFLLCKKIQRIIKGSVTKKFNFCPNLPSHVIPTLFEKVMWFSV